MWDAEGRGRMGTPLGVSPEDWPGARKSVFIGGGHHRAAVSSRLCLSNSWQTWRVIGVKLMI